MSTDRDVTRIVRSWLEEGVTALPDRVLDAVLDQVPATSQRRALWPARRFREMNNVLKLAIVAAAVMVIAVVGFNLVPRRAGIGGPGPSPTAAPTTTPSPTPTALPTSASNINATGSFAPGATYVIDDPCCLASGRMTFSVPAAGWFAFDPILIVKNAPGTENVELKIGPELIGNIYTGGCHWHGTELVPLVGPTVDELANALFEHAGAGASPPTATIVGGYSGKKVEMQIPASLDVTTCDSDGDYPIVGRFVSDGGFGAQPYTYGNGQHDTFYILDVGGKRQVINAMYLPGASAVDRAELDQILASFRFEPLASTSSPSPSLSPSP